MSQECDVEWQSRWQWSTCHYNSSTRWNVKLCGLAALDSSTCLHSSFLCHPVKKASSPPGHGAAPAFWHHAPTFSSGNNFFLKTTSREKGKHFVKSYFNRWQRPSPVHAWLPWSWSRSPPPTSTLKKKKFDPPGVRGHWVGFSRGAQCRHWVTRGVRTIAITVTWSHPHAVHATLRVRALRPLCVCVEGGGRSGKVRDSCPPTHTDFL